MTRLLPPWWLHQYRQLTRAHLSAGLALARYAPLSPVLPLAEWDAFGVLLGELQAQVIRQPRRHLTTHTMDEDCFVELLAGRGEFPVDVVARLWSALGCLRVNGEGSLPFAAVLSDKGDIHFSWDEDQAGSLFGIAMPWSRPPDGLPVTVADGNWYALPAAERLTYALMEQQLQASHSRRGSASLHDLVPDSSGDIVSQLKRLMNLGKILEASQFLQPLSPDDALSATSHGNDVVVTWLAREHSGARGDEMIAGWWEWYLTGRSWGDFKDQLPFSDHKKLEMTSLWQTLSHHYDHHCDRLPLKFVDGRVYSSLLVYMEYLARSGRGLPEEWDDPSIVELFHEATPENVAAKFYRFVDLLQLSDEFRSSVLVHSCFAEVRKPAVEQATAELPEPVQQSQPAEVASIVDQKAPDRHREREEAKRISQALRARLRKAAADELQKMDAKKYGALKRSYLESLDDSARRMMLDVQKRMQAGLFDDHLKAHLIGFMVDHPGAWSASGPGISAGQNGRS